MFRKFLNFIRPGFRQPMYTSTELMDRGYSQYKINPNRRRKRTFTGLRYNSRYKRGSSLKKFLKYQLKEKKYIDVNYASVTTIPLSTSYQIALLNALQLGNSYYQRDGRIVRNIGLQFAIDIYSTKTNAAAIVESTARIAIVYDREPHGITPTLPTIFQTRDIGNNVAQTIDAGINTDHRERFKILWQGRFTLPPLGINGVPASEQMITTSNEHRVDKYLKLNLTTIYNAGNNGSIADIEKGAIWVVCYADAGDQPSPAYRFTFTSRLTYYE